MFYAAEQFSADTLIEFLVSKGLALTIKDHKGATCLHYAARWFSTDIVEFLLKQGLAINAKDSEGATSLAHYAVKGYSTSIVQFLLERGLRSQGSRRGWSNLFALCSSIEFDR